jgi:hypothetical protein
MASDAVRLRPMGLGDLLDAALALYRNNFALFAGIVAVFAIPQAIITILLQLVPSGKINSGTTQHPVYQVDEVKTYLIVAVIVVLVGIIFSTMITGALARAIAYRYLGEQTTITGAYSSMGSRMFLSLLAASFLQPILILVPIVPFAVIALLLAAFGANDLALLVIIVSGIAWAVFAALAYVRWTFVAQCIAIERRGPIDGLQRSWHLSNSAFWRILGYRIVLGIAVGVASAAVGGIGGALLALASGPAAHAAGSAVSAIVGIVLQPFQFGVLTLLYYDLRIRREGFDLEHMARTMSGADTLAVDPGG